MLFFDSSGTKFRAKNIDRGLAYNIAEFSTRLFSGREIVVGIDRVTARDNVHDKNGRGHAVNQLEKLF